MTADAVCAESVQKPPDHNLGRIAPTVSNDGRDILTDGALRGDTQKHAFACCQAAFTSTSRWQSA